MAKETINWTCGYCQMPQVATEVNFHRPWSLIHVGKNALGDVGAGWLALACQNQQCRQLSLSFRLTRTAQDITERLYEGEIITTWQALPEPSGKPQPDYIPVVLRKDYEEACKIRDLSPKAAATLARRCLQGMIRDFGQVAKHRLVDEIDALRKLVEDGKAPSGVTYESVDAIDHVRGIGNIGAHMEKDVDLIIDIDPGEAQVLIELIEMLFSEWYVQRHLRLERLAKIAAIREEKDNQKRNGKT